MMHLLLLLWLWEPGPSPTPPALAPLQIAGQFLAPTGWPAMRSYLCCEAAGQAKRQTLGQQIPLRVQRTCQLVAQDSAAAVVAVELRDSTSRRDFYLHFSKSTGTWKLRAVRGLAMTHLSRPMVSILTAMPPAEVAQYDLKHPDAHHAFTVGNLRLWISADADIATHFQRNRADFEAVLRLVQTGHYFEPPAPEAAPNSGEQAANADPAVHALLRKLYLSHVTRRETGCGSCLEFVIGGKMNSTVGLLYQPQPTQLPRMHPDRLIVLKPLGAGWYLYKTA